MGHDVSVHCPRGFLLSFACVDLIICSLSVHCIACMIAYRYSGGIDNIDYVTGIGNSSREQFPIPFT